MDGIIFLRICLVILAVAMGGIVYLQFTGQAGEHSWTEKDIDQWLGGVASLIIGLTYLGIFWLSIWFLYLKVLPRLPSPVPPIIHIVIYFTCVYVVGKLLSFVDIHILKRWSVWRWLHYWTERAKKPDQLNDKGDLSTWYKRMCQRFKTRWEP